MSGLLQAAWGEALARALLHFLWQGALLGLLAGGTLAALGRSSARARYGTAYAFLLAMAAAPGITFVLALRPELPAWLGPDAAPAAALFRAAPLEPSLRPFLPSVVAVWGFGVLLGLVRMAGGFWRVRGYLRAPWEPLDAFWTWRLRRHAARLGLRGAVEVRVAKAVSLPMAARFLRPVVWMPAALFGALDPLQIDALLAHELAHVARRDWLFNGLQSVLEALLFYHPAVWWLSRRIRQEREHACDDLAVALCGDAIALAEALAALEGLRPPTPRRAPGLIPSLELGAHGGSLMHRIRRLLFPDPSWPPAFLTPRAGLAALLVAGVAAALPAARSLPVPNPGPAPQASPAPRPGAAPGSTSTTVVNEDDGRVRRSYRTWKDAQGAVHERYAVNGVERPLDDEGRRWLAHRKEQAERAEAQAREAEARAEQAERQAEQAERQARALELQARALALRSDALSRKAEAARPDAERLGKEAARRAEQAARMEADARRLEAEAEKLSREMATMQAEAAEKALDAVEAAADRAEEEFQDPEDAPEAPTPQAHRDGVEGGVRGGVAGGVRGGVHRTPMPSLPALAPRVPRTPVPPVPPRAARAPKAALAPTPAATPPPAPPAPPARAPRAAPPAPPPPPPPPPPPAGED